MDASKAPPLMRKELTYKDWKTDVLIWKSFVGYDKKKLGPALFLSLTGSACDAAREISLTDLEKEDGFDTLITKLDSLYLKDEKNSAFEAYETFEKYQRPQDMDMYTYINTFERLYHKAKSHKLDPPDGILAYRLLKSANLSHEHEQLVQATLDDLTYEKMKTQLKKIFSDISNSPLSTSMKVEPAYEATHDNYYTRGGYNQIRAAGANRFNRGRFNYRGGSSAFHGNRGNAHPARGNIHAQGRSDYAMKPRRRLNPLDHKGEVTLCSICGSKFHWARQCPDSYEAAQSLYTESKDETQGEPVLITLFAKFHDHNENDETMTIFFSETLNFAVVDSGCSKTVCGKLWLKCYLDSLNDSDSKLVVETQSQTCFKFGDGNKIRSLKKVKFPAYIAENKFLIEADVIPNDIPLLLSKDSMKKCSANLNFHNDSITIFGTKVPLSTTSSGHYLISIGNTDVKFSDSQIKTILFSSQFEKADENERFKIAEKLHKQFGHTRSHKLKAICADAGIDDQNFLKMFKKIEDDCEICFRKQRGPSRPVVGFNLAKEFNEVVALDLKQWSHSPTIWFCHMIDLATRYSVCVIIRNKQKETIINAIMKGWISIFGCPQQVHSDNGCEFNNEDFRSMAECFNIRVSTTAAESPWSNGCNERYNGIISEMVEKVLADTKCSLEVALAWAVSAKNSLQNHYGFSPNQLVFGRNPNYPSILYDELPALENKTSCEIVRTNANARHSARSAFIQKESCEKLRRAMLHKVRPTGETFNNGDHVFYRRSNDKQWQGPATVIGQENKQILVKHGGVYYRCHECNLIKRNGKIFGNNDERNNKSVSKVHPQGHEQESPIRRVYIDDKEENCDRQLSNDHNENASVNDFNGSLVPSNDITGADTGARIEPNETDIGTEDSIQHKDNSDITNQQPFLPAPKMRIAYVQNNNNIPCWKNATVLGRAGKVTGKNKYCLNILDDGDESGKCVDWRNVDDWK